MASKTGPGYVLETLYGKHYVFQAEWVRGEVAGLAGGGPGRLRGWAFAISDIRIGVKGVSACKHESARAGREAFRSGPIPTNNHMTRDPAPGPQGPLQWRAAAAEKQRLWMRTHVL